MSKKLTNPCLPSKVTLLSLGKRSVNAVRCVARLRYVQSGIRFAYDTYGEERVAMISTHVTFQARAAVRELDVESARRDLRNPSCPLLSGTGKPRRRPDDVEFASRWRAAVARALVDRGLLHFKTRRVSPPISTFLATVFS